MTSSLSGHSISHAAYSLLNRAVIVASGFINVLFMVRILPKDDLGTWVLFASIASILEMIRGGFIRNPFITHYVSASVDDRPPITTASLVLHVLLALLISLLLLLTSAPVADFWKAPVLTDLLAIYALNTLAFIPFMHFEDVLTAYLDFRTIFLSNLARVGLLTSFIAISFFFNLSIRLTDIAVVQLIATVAGTLVALGPVRKTAKYRLKLNYRLLSDLFHFGKFTFGTNMSSMFIRSTDSWLIGRLISTSAVATYNPALKLVNLFEVPTIAIANYIFPQIHPAMRRGGKDAVKKIYLMSVSLMLSFIIPLVIPLFVFSEFFVTTIFGEEYLEAADILKITILYALILPFNRQFGTVMDGLKKPKLNFYLLVLAAVLNLIFNVVGLMNFGLIGSAYGTLVSYLILFALNQLILYRTFKISVLDVIPLVFQWYDAAWNLLSRRPFSVVNRGPRA